MGFDNNNLNRGDCANVHVSKAKIEKKTFLPSKFFNTFIPLAHPCGNDLGRIGHTE